MKCQDVFRPQNKLAWLSSIAVLCGSSFSVLVKAQILSYPELILLGERRVP